MFEYISRTDNNKTNALISIAGFPKPVIWAKREGHCTLSAQENVSLGGWKAGHVELEWRENVLTWSTKTSVNAALFELQISRIK